MSAPIESATQPKPQLKATPRTPSLSDSPKPNEPRPASQPPARRSTEKTRTEWQSQQSLPPMNADGMLFSQLLMSPLGEELSPLGSGSGSSFSMPLITEAIPTEMIDELAQQLPAQTGEPFSVTLLMPNLGRVHINANKRESHWDIEMSFARPNVLRRLLTHKVACENAMTHALGHKVQLSLNDEFFL